MVAVDVWDPMAPVIVGVLRTPSHLGGIELANGLVYLSSRIAGLRVMDFGPEYRRTLPIEIEIRPGSDVDTINPASRGVIPVAVLGSADFDVSEVNVSKLAFGPDFAPQSGAGRSLRRDVNSDGFVDLMARFRIGESGIEAGDTDACISGEMIDGVPFLGCAAIQTVSH